MLAFMVSYTREPEINKMNLNHLHLDLSAAYFLALLLLAF